MIIAYLIALVIAICIFYIGYRIVDPIYEEEFLGGWVCGAITMVVGVAVVAFFVSLGV